MNANNNTLTDPKILDACSTVYDAFIQLSDSSKSAAWAADSTETPNDFYNTVVARFKELRADIITIQEAIQELNKAIYSD